MSKPRIMIPMLVMAGLCLLAGCGGTSAPAASTPPPAAAPSGNASQGGGVNLDDPSKVAGSPEGGGIKNP